jgi:hypothetical protein
MERPGAAADAANAGDGSTVVAARGADDYDGAGNDGDDCPFFHIRPLLSHAVFDPSCCRTSFTGTIPPPCSTATASRRALPLFPKSNTPYPSAAISLKTIVAPATYLHLYFISVRTAL